MVPFYQSRLSDPNKIRAGCLGQRDAFVACSGNALL
jgi:hypothetical protein